MSLQPPRNGVAIPLIAYHASRMNAVTLANA